MPCYEYHCDACGHDFEEMQKITDKPIRVCPDCGARKAHRVISKTSFVLKGTGWYTTDYARAGGKAGRETGESKHHEGADAGSGSGAKADEGKKADAKADEGKKADADAKAKPKTEGKKDAKPAKGSHAHA